MKRSILFLISIATLNFNCNFEQNSKEILSNFTQTVEQRSIILQPFQGFPKSKAEKLKNKLGAFNKNIEILPSIELPEFAFYEPRKRHRADSLLKHLKSFNLNSNKIIVGVTNKDISTRSNKSVDFGIFGLAHCPGSTCVISEFRLKKDNKDDQLFKVAIHEIGHAEGLPHCPNKGCYMEDAKGKNKTDSLADFCNDCKKFLTKKSWQFNK